MYKEDLALDNLQGVICHRTKPNLSNLVNFIGFKLIYLYSEDTFFLVYIICIQVELEEKIC